MTRADFEAMRANIADIKEILIRREVCQEKCERVHKWAFGNGVLGADEVIARLNRWYGGLWQIATGVVTGAVVGIVVLLVGWMLE
jgi:hypothetical protein